MCSFQVTCTCLFHTLPRCVYLAWAHSQGNLGGSQTILSSTFMYMKELYIGKNSYIHVLGVAIGFWFTGQVGI